MEWRMNTPIGRVMVLNGLILVHKGRSSGLALADREEETLNDRPPERGDHIGSISPHRQLAALEPGASTATRN